MSPRERLHTWFVRLGEFLTAGRVRRELDEELQFHIDAEVAHNISKGLSLEDARRAAMNSFGGVERFRAETRDARGLAWLDGMLRDVRLALRRLRRSPAFSTGIVATLGVALGAATAIGALVYGVTLRSLPYVDADRIVRISVHTPGLGVGGTEQSAGTYVFFAERAKSFTMIGGSMENDGVAITDGDTPERTTVAMVTPSLFRVLGTNAVVGRVFRDEEARVMPDPPVLISHALWLRRFGGAADIAGKTLELNRRKRVILGVLPAGFDYPSREVNVYFPDYVEATRAGLNDRYLTVVARLAPGVTVAAAQLEVNRLSAQLRERFPELSETALAEAKFSARVETLRDAIASPVRSELTLLAIMTAALLLIAIANAATLTLLRAQRMQGEVAVSRALGAGRGTILQRFVIEGVVICLAGSILALPIATAAINSHFGLTDKQIPRLHGVAMTPALALSLVAFSVIVGLVLGLVATARASGSKGSVSLTLRSAARTTQGRTWRRAQEGLVGLQIALALSLLLAAGLMGTSLVRLNMVNFGFDPTGKSKFTVHLPFRAYSTYQRVAAFHLSVVDALRRVPGVTAVGAAMQFPSTSQSLYSHPKAEAVGADGQVRQTLIDANVASPDYFRTMGIPLVAGRSFLPGDLSSSNPGVVLSASAARQLFGNEDPIGREVRIAARPGFPAYRVIGVSGDVYSDRPIEGVLRVMYFPLLNDLSPSSTETEQRIPFMPAGMTFVVKASLGERALPTMFRQVVASVDPRVPLWDIRSLQDVIDDSTARTRLTMVLLSAAALATLLLGVIGLYSVIAYAVAGRSREFAVRLAIGATPRAIKRQVLREGAFVAAGGIAAGLILSFAATRVLADLVYGVSTTDPIVYSTSAIIVLLATAVATYSPARRAGNISPVRALHGE